MQKNMLLHMEYMEKVSKEKKIFNLIRRCPLSVPENFKTFEHIWCIDVNTRPMTART